MAGSLGYVYFILSPKLKRVKIGYTKLNPDVRFNSLATASPDHLQRLALKRGTIADERALHRRFEAHRVCGEWFRYSKKIATFVAEEAFEWEPLHEQVERDGSDYATAMRHALTPAETACCVSFGIDPKASNALTLMRRATATYAKRVIGERLREAYRLQS